MRYSLLLIALSAFIGCVTAQRIRLPFLDSRGRRQDNCPSCIKLTDCPPMLRLLATRTRAAIYQVQRAICGYEGERSKVCCPVPEPTAPFPPGQDLLPTNCGFSDQFRRIYGGRNTSIGSYPWVAAFGYLVPGNAEVQFHCAGSLINDRYILTAAHCLDPSTLEGRRLVEIRLGDWNLASENDCQMENNTEVCAPPFTRVTMETAISHPNYAKRFQYSDDIALIRLTERLDLQRLSPNIMPICLPPTFAPGQVAPGQNVTAVGWGMTKQDMLSDILQRVDLPIVDGQICKDVYGTAFGDRQICAGGMEGKDTCSGDSGGPLITSRGPPFQQVGIVSFGLSVCGTNNTPAVYTDVKEYKTWILQNLKP